MALKKRAFVRYKTDEEKAEEKGKVFTIRLNAEEIQQLEEDARILEQEKPGTTLKLLAEIGHNVLHSELTGKVIRTIFINKQRNKRIGINIADPKF